MGSRWTGKNAFPTPVWARYCPVTASVSPNSPSVPWHLLPELAVRPLFSGFHPTHVLWLTHAAGTVTHRASVFVPPCSVHTAAAPSLALPRGLGGSLSSFPPWKVFLLKLTGAVSSLPSLDPPLPPLGPCSTSPAPIAASMFLYSIYLVSVKHGDFLSSRYSCLLHLHTRKRKGNRKGKDILVTIFKKLKKNFHLVFL